MGIAIDGVEWEEERRSWHMEYVGDGELRIVVPHRTPEERREAQKPEWEER